MHSTIGRALARVATVAFAAVLTGCGSVAGSSGPSAAPATERAAAQPSPVVVTPEPTSAADDTGIAASTMLATSDLPAGWTAVGGPPTVHSGPSTASGCVPPPLIANTTASAGEEFSYLLNAQGLEKGHLTEAALVFGGPADLDAYIRNVVTTPYRTCIAEQVQNQTAVDGVTIAGAASTSVVPLPAELHGLHVHISFPYVFAGQSKVAQDEVVYLTGSRVRVLFEFDTCCSPFPATMVDQVLSQVAAKMRAGGAF